MAYLLAIETATKVCSIALFKNADLLGLKEEKGDYSHAENIAVFADDLLKENSIKSTELSAVVVSKGPGSYTGLRIGVSFAKGLCYALKIPLISIDTLQALVFGWQQQNNLEQYDFICPMIDARRMEVYASIFDSKMNLIKPISADVIEVNSYEEIILNSKVVFIGDGAKKCEAILQKKDRVFKSDLLSSASFLGVEGFRKFQEFEFEDVAYFEPFYLKEFIALKGKKLV